MHTIAMICKSDCTTVATTGNVATIASIAHSEKKKTYRTSRLTKDNMKDIKYDPDSEYNKKMPVSGYV